jgi:predicted dehydrogenase
LRVRAVCDPSLGRAEREASRLGCAVAGGVTELLERSDIDAVLLLDPGWLGLWPLEQACQAGKHVLCAALPLGEAERIASLCRQVPESGPRVVMPLAPRLWRLVREVWFLLERRLGPVRLLRLHWSVADQHSLGSALEAPLLLPLLMACGELFEAELEMVQVAGLPGSSGHGCLVLGFSEGKMAELSIWRGPAMRSTGRIEFVAERGSGVAELPNEVRWHDTEGNHQRRLPARPAEAEVLEGFVQGVRGRLDAGPTLPEVQRALAWLGRARGKESTE